MCGLTTSPAESLTVLVIGIDVSAVIALLFGNILSATAIEEIACVSDAEFSDDEFSGESILVLPLSFLRPQTPKYTFAHL